MYSPESLSPYDASSSDDVKSKKAVRRERRRSRSRGRSRSRSHGRRRSASSSSSDTSSRRKHSHKRGKSKKRSKHSKHSKRKHKHKSRHSDRSKSAVDQAKFGKYGVINAGHFFDKQREFEAWCREVKNINNLALPKTELKEIFGSFIEDYNTATMPHEKYYNMDKWEMAEMKRRGGDGPGTHKAYSTHERDEDARRQELAEGKRRAEEAHFREVLANMDSKKVAAMRSQQALQAQMELAYKTGNKAEAERLMRKLAPDP